MSTPSSGRKRAQIKDRFSAEDEALSSIAREAEARLAAKRAARAEARDIRMRELERQQKEFTSHQSSSSKKWGQIQQWMADTEKARHSNQSKSQSRRGLKDDAMSVHSSGSYRSSASLLLGNLHYSSLTTSSRKKSLVSDGRSSSLKSSHSTSSVYNDLHRKSASSRKKPDLLTGLYYDQTKYSSLGSSKLPPPLSSTAATHQPWVSSTTSIGLTRSHSAASISDASLYGPYGSRATSEYSWCSSGASSTRSSPVSSSDDDSASTTSQDHIKHGRRDSVSSELSDMSETAADYFSRSNRRGSIISDLDDLSIPDLDILEEKCDKQYSDPFSRPSSRCATPGLSAATLATLGGTSSRRGSGEMSSIVIEPDASLSELRDIYDLKDQIQDVEGRYMQGLKELKESLSEVEEKYKKAMVSNAQLDNDKANLIYQVDTLKDVIEEMEEQMSELSRETEEKSKEIERQKHTCSVLLHKQEELKEGIRQRDELIEANQNFQFKLDTLTREVFDLQETVNWKNKKIAALERQKEYFDCIRNERDELKDELAELKGKSKSVEKHGLVIIPEGTANGDDSRESHTSVISLVSQESAQVLESAGDGPLDTRLRKLAEEKDELLSQIRKLKTQLQDERQKHSKMESVYSEGERLENGTDLNIIEMQRDVNRQISEYKFKLSKAEQEMGTMEQNINRLEAQVLRYKASADNFEKIEDELKAEKRKLQRELRGALDKIEEMEMTNNHLVKRLEKMKANRNALLSQQ
ncbi:leucine-rich repeat flightless-interacting protein 2 isoform X2 [Tachysurus fulvidraco]|uniref:leucine-rich repeat flightless-interacting protein 2 isoform X2 n=1 Tax=Tachysurus fulvidraco TaxID=1234273 RepID=UPI001FEE1BE2|nr:leucine-rich repeat flightless-interacting protein 2 isoform X2 [Tachysurus fulvidraco]